MVKSFRRDNRGQVLVVSGLLVALILLSTAFYVIEVSKNVPTVQTGDSVNFDAYKNCIKSTLISALANASNGGNQTVLNTDLAQLKTALTTHSYSALLTIDFGTQNGSGYQNGLMLNWNSSGTATSSAAATCVVNAKTPTGKSAAVYSFNVSTQVSASGSYQTQNDTKLVTLTVNVKNDGAATVAQSLLLKYLNGTEWTAVDAPAVTDHGDGSYTVTFSVSDTEPSAPLNVSVQCWDTRGVTAVASVTCNNI